MSITNLYFSAKGRINRKQYIFAGLPLIAVGIIALILDNASGSRIFLAYGVFELGAMIILIWPAVCLGVKRLHDRNRTGWYLLLSCVPLVNFWIAIEVWFLKGTIGENKYGQDPLAQLGHA